MAERSLLLSQRELGFCLSEIFQSCLKPHHQAEKQMHPLLPMEREVVWRHSSSEDRGLYHFSTCMLRWFLQRRLQCSYLLGKHYLVWFLLEINHSKEPYFPVLAQLPKALIVDTILFTSWRTSVSWHIIGQMWWSEKERQYFRGLLVP